MATLDELLNVVGTDVLQELLEETPAAEQEHFVKVVQFKQAAFARAQELGPQVWKNWDFVKDAFKWSPVEPDDKVNAALSYAGHPQAIGRSLLRRVERYTLLVSYRAMDLSADKLDKILLHELVHMGYRGHGKDFRAVCQEVGGVVSGSGITDPGVHVEKKVGHRYRRVHTAKTEAEAMTWLRAEQTRMRAAGEPGVNWRLSFG